MFESDGAILILWTIPVPVLSRAAVRTAPSTRVVVFRDKAGCAPGRSFPGSPLARSGGCGGRVLPRIDLPVGEP